MKQVTHGTSSRLVIASVALAVVLLVLQPYWQYWSYVRTEIVDAPWRLWMAHFVHLNWPHALVNIAALLLLPVIFPRLPASLLIGAGVIVLPIWISVGFLIFNPELMGYAGFSGVLHGLYMLAALYYLVHYPSERLIAIAVLLGIGLKITAEQLHWLALSDQLLQIQVMVDAHLYGALGALLYIFGTITIKIACLFYKNR